VANDDSHEREQERDQESDSEGKDAAHSVPILRSSRTLKRDFSDERRQWVPRAQLVTLRAESATQPLTTAVGHPDARDSWVPRASTRSSFATLPAPVSKWLKLGLPRRVSP